MKLSTGKEVLQQALTLLALTTIMFTSMSMRNALNKQTQVTLTPIKGILMSINIQQAIDSCAAAGGGVVVFQPGTYLTGTLQLKSNVTLQLDKGAIIQGSDQYANYKFDAFIYGKDLTNIVIKGEGTIDGVDCYNPKGEEGFRGPHCIRLINCKNIALRGIHIKNSANWAINCRYCSKGTVDKVTIRGGHDGLHTSFCDNFTVTGCDFRTGDDCFAGNDNRNFLVTNCLVNTSCSGFRFGCLNFTVKHCRIWGPGEFAHRIAKVKRMPTAFVHFSPPDELTKLESGHWLIEDCVVDSVEHFYWYNHKDGLWQTGQPASDITFKNVKATGVQSAFYIMDDTTRRFSLTLENCSFSFLEGNAYKAEEFEGIKILSTDFFYASGFGQICLKNVTLKKNESKVVMRCKLGNKLMMDKVNFITDKGDSPYQLDEIKEIKNNR